MANHFKRLAADGDRLYIVMKGFGDIWQYQGTPFNWEKIDVANQDKEIAAGGGQLYLVKNGGGVYGEIWRYLGKPGNWETIARKSG